MKRYQSATITLAAMCLLACTPAADTPMDENDDSPELIAEREKSMEAIALNNQLSEPGRVAESFVTLLFRYGDIEGATKLMEKEDVERTDIEHKHSKIIDLTATTVEERVFNSLNSADITVEISGTWQGESRKTQRVVTLKKNSSNWLVTDF